MRAKTVSQENVAIVFDFDDTLIKTDAKLHIYDRGKYLKSLTPAEFNEFKNTEKYDLDFSDFRNPNFILKGKKYRGWYVLKAENRKIKLGYNTGDIFILTARTPHTRTAIFRLLKNNSIKIKYENVITLGDDIGEINIADEKRKVLTKIANSYQGVRFYDDNEDNIELAKSINGVKTILVK